MGTVSFKDGNTVMGTGTLTTISAGVYKATFTTSTLTAGTHPVTAVYSGDANFNQSSSSILNQIVNPYPASARMNTAVTPAPSAHFDLKAYPNPTTSYFNVKLESSNITQPITLNVVDVSGKLVEVRKNLVSGQTLQLGAKYRPGMYFVEMLQGDTRRIVKLVKQPD
jgi:hypothetical protein